MTQVFDGHNDALSRLWGTSTDPVADFARNLTDDQLRAIGQTGGMVGLNFASVFLSDDGWMRGHATIDDCLRQLDHMITVAGEDHVGLGSDFDGAPMPHGIKDASDLPALIAVMRAHRLWRCVDCEARA